MGYGELCEYYAGLGMSGSDAAHYASIGVRPQFDEYDGEEWNYSDDDLAGERLDDNNVEIPSR